VKILWIADEGPSAEEERWLYDHFESAEIVTQRFLQTAAHIARVYRRLECGDIVVVRPDPVIAELLLDGIKPLQPIFKIGIVQSGSPNNHTSQREYGFSHFERTERFKLLTTKNL
jgi:hypothetical protein